MVYRGNWFFFAKDIILQEVIEMMTKWITTFDQVKMDLIN